MTNLDTTDAQVWAAEFVRIFAGKEIREHEAEGAVDEGTMIAWFANAIETGRSAGRKETCPHGDTFFIDDTTECCRKCGSLLDVPTLGDKFVEGFQEGRPSD